MMHIKVNGRMILIMDLVHIYGKMETNTREIGKKDNGMAMLQ
jgi:hypothetical protein